MKYLRGSRALWILLSLYIVSKPVQSGQMDSTFEYQRSKRQVNSLPLVYPYGATYKLLIGYAAPVPNKDHINLLFVGNFQYQYLQFQNITQLSQYYFVKEVGRDRRDGEANDEQTTDERLVFYRSIAEFFDAKGLNGMECVLRAICEAAQNPIEDQGLIGELVHILLTPDYGKSPFEHRDPDWEASMKQFVDAATAGKQMFSCSSIYTECPKGQGLMEMISVLREH